VLVISPVLESWGRYRWDALHARVRDAGESAGLVVLDPLPAWRGVQDPEVLRVGGDNLHYGRTGNRVLGEAIAGAVRDLLADEVLAHE
jgi:hypothetical protein